MQNIKISMAQFENKSGDKDDNLSVINRQAQKVASEGSKIIAFHDCTAKFPENLIKRNRKWFGFHDEHNWKQKRKFRIFYWVQRWK